MSSLFESRGYAQAVNKACSRREKLPDIRQLLAEAGPCPRGLGSQQVDAAGANAKQIAGVARTRDRAATRKLLRFIDEWGGFCNAFFSHASFCPRFGENVTIQARRALGKAWWCRRVLKEGERRRVASFGLLSFRLGLRDRVVEFRSRARNRKWRQTHLLHLAHHTKVHTITPLSPRVRPCGR